MFNDNIYNGETPTVSEQLFEHYAHDIVPRASHNKNYKVSHSSTASVPRQDNDLPP